MRSLAFILMLVPGAALASIKFFHEEFAWVLWKAELEGYPPLEAWFFDATLGGLIFFGFLLSIFTWWGQRQAPEEEKKVVYDTSEGQSGMVDFNSGTPGNQFVSYKEPGGGGLGQADGGYDEVGGGGGNKWVSYDD